MAGQVELMKRGRHEPRFAETRSGSTEIESSWTIDQALNSFVA
jgi:hypothetical protein